MSSRLQGQPVTFTAVVTNVDPLQPTPTGTVTFEDKTFQGSMAVTNILGAGVLLVDGVARRWPRVRHNSRTNQPSIWNVT